jgi:hypothetical protein
MIKYLKGDLFNFVKPGVIIPHVVNNKGKMAAGFVVPLCRKYPKVKNDYYALYHNTGLFLGDTQFVRPCEGVWVANMIAQTLYDRGRPLRYNRLCRCMESVADFCDNNDLKILAPKFGSALAGGNWDFITELIQDIWIDRGIEVTICEL